MRFCPVVLSANGRIKPDVRLLTAIKKSGTRRARITSNGAMAQSVSVEKLGSKTRFPSGSFFRFVFFLR